MVVGVALVTGRLSRTVTVTVVVSMRLGVIVSWLGVAVSGSE